jgi:hypothetical protein
VGVLQYCAQGQRWTAGAILGLYLDELGKETFGVRHAGHHPDEYRSSIPEVNILTDTTTTTAQAGRSVVKMHGTGY